MHPALIKLMATERAAALHAAAEHRRRQEEPAPRPGRFARAARRALRPAHA